MSDAVTRQDLQAAPGLWTSTEVRDGGLVGEIFHDLLVEPVTKMDAWIADWGGRAFCGCLSSGSPTCTRQ